MNLSAELVDRSSEKEGEAYRGTSAMWLGLARGALQRREADLIKRRGQWIT